MQDSLINIFSAHHLCDGSKTCQGTAVILHDTSFNFAFKWLPDMKADF